MSDHSTRPTAGAAPSPVEEPMWRDDPDYPHRIENHVKVYLHVEDDADGRGQRWCVSKVAVDGLPLDGSEDGHYCDYEGHPLGARPDWDRQHRAAQELDLPTAGELFPMLAHALGSSYVDPMAEQVAAVRQIITEHCAWQAERADLSSAEAAGDPPAHSEWHESDDLGRELADRAVALLAELIGQEIPTGEAAAPETPSDVSLMLTMLDAPPPTSSMKPGHEPISTPPPPSRPAR